MQPTNEYIHRMNLLGECDEWDSARDWKGYGRIKLDDKVYGAHRIVMMQEVGYLAPEQNVLHRCDNPPCIRLDHLWVGSQADNAHDRDEKGRHVSHNSSKTQCVHGHDLDEVNTYRYPNGRRACRTCRKQDSREYRRSQNPNGEW
jgi:hypothetical protein